MRVDRFGKIYGRHLRRHLVGGSGRTESQDFRQPRIGNALPLPPTLHCRVVPVPEGASERADATALCDEGLMLVHGLTVRTKRTFVKGVDYVPAFCDYTYMANGKTTGEALIALKDRANLSLEQIAKGAGYRGKSSVQEYFKPDYESPLGPNVATKLATALEGKGTPPITWEDVISLAGVGPKPNARPIMFEGASDQRMNYDLPIYGTALGAEMIVEGEAIEQTTLNKGEIIGYAQRPVILNGVPDAYGLHVQGSSMDPVHVDGAFIVAQRNKPLRIGDDVVVYLRPRDETDDGETARMVLVKRLVRRSAQFVELRQFTPDITFRIPADEVLRVDRVLTLGDLLS